MQSPCPPQHWPCCGVAGPALAGPTLDAVKGRGKLVCAANGNRAGFSALDSKGQWKGMDIDTCRALAAAVLGDADKVEFLKTTTQTRFTVLQTGEVDVTAANVTWTLTRDAKLGIDFVTPTFYDGQGFMVSKKLGVKSVTEMNGATVCVLPGSTSEKVAAEVANANRIAFKMVVIENQKELNTAFFSGRCDAHVQTTSGLAANRSAAASDPDEYVILPGVHGKDPMGPVVRQGDAQWRDIVNWTVFALFEAEEKGVTSKNVDDMLKSNDETVQLPARGQGRARQGPGPRRSVGLSHRQAGGQLRRDLRAQRRQGVSDEAGPRPERPVDPRRTALLAAVQLNDASEALPETGSLLAPHLRHAVPLPPR